MWTGKKRKKDFSLIYMFFILRFFFSYVKQLFKVVGETCYKKTNSFKVYILFLILCWRKVLKTKYFKNGNKSHSLMHFYITSKLPQTMSHQLWERSKPIKDPHYMSSKRYRSPVFSPVQTQALNEDLEVLFFLQITKSWIN